MGNVMRPVNHTSLFAQAGACLLASCATAGAAWSQGAAQSATATCDVVVRTEVTIDRSPAEVWPVLLDARSWKLSVVNLETISGQSGAEGEVRRVTQKSGDQHELATYFMRVVRQRPHEQLVFKLWPIGGSDFLAYADFSLIDLDGRTRLIYDVYAEYRSSESFQDEMNANACAQSAARAMEERLMRENLQLKARVERMPRAGHGNR